MKLSGLLTIIALIGLLFSTLVAEADEYGLPVCKVIGRGFFLLPGTDTCIKFSGIVRGQLDYNIDTKIYKEESKSVLSLAIGSQTDFGKLTGKLSFEAAGNPAAKKISPKFSQGIIGLNRFKIGFSASNWVRYEWGGFNIKSGPFAYHKADMLAFEDTIMGVKLRLAAEYPENTTLQLPSVIAHFSKRWKSVSLFASGVYSLEKNLQVRVMKTGVVFRINKIKEGFRVKFQATSGIDEIGKYIEGDRWDFIAALSFPIAKKLKANFTFGTSDIFNQKYSFAGNLVWRPVEKFKIISELSFVQGGSLGGLIRVQRTF